MRRAFCLLLVIALFAVQLGASAEIVYNFDDDDINSDISESGNQDDEGVGEPAAFQEARISKLAAMAEEKLGDAAVFFNGASIAYIGERIIKLNPDFYAAKAVITGSDEFMVPSSVMNVMGKTEVDFLDIGEISYINLREYANGQGLHFYTNSHGLAVVSREILFEDDPVCSKIINISNPQTVMDEIISWFKFESHSIVDIIPVHPRIKDLSIGIPAVIKVGDMCPSYTIEAKYNSVIDIWIYKPDGRLLGEKKTVCLNSFEKQDVEFDLKISAPGTYKVVFDILLGSGENYSDASYFTARNKTITPSGEAVLAYIGEKGLLEYTPDHRGNRLLDYSQVGYKMGEEPIPNIPIAEVIEPAEGDDGLRIQEAVDRICELPIRSNGFRGALLIKKGRYEIGDSVYVRKGGIVIRGEGQTCEGTNIVATGSKSRDTFVFTGGGGAKAIKGSEREILDLYVPLGARNMRVENASDFRVGDKVIIRRLGTESWIHEINMDTIALRDPQNPGLTQQWAPFDLDFERTITDITNDIISVDVPLGSPIEKTWGGGLVVKYSDDDRIENVGIENIYFQSEFKSPTDERHADFSVTFNNAINGWARDITMQYYRHGFRVERGARNITLCDNTAIDPRSVIAGGRRYGFYILGQMNLVTRCYARDYRHSFVFTSRVQGPNVFYECVSENDHSSSEPHHRWSVSGLYDNVNSTIYIQDRAFLGSGQGWAGAFYVLWNTMGEAIIQKPPTAQNWGIGHAGNRSVGARPRPEGLWESLGTFVEPGSLYIQQLYERLGEGGVSNISSVPSEKRAVINQTNENIPKLLEISINKLKIEGFNSNIYDYTIYLPRSQTKPPLVEAVAEKGSFGEVYNTTNAFGTAKIKVVDSTGDGNGVYYSVRFVRLGEGAVIALENQEDSGKTVDGDYSTVWNTKGEHFIQYEFSEPKTGELVGICWGNSLKRRYSFEIYISKDGCGWQKAFEGQSSGKTELLERYRLSLACDWYRYMRIVLKGNNFNDENSIAEVIF
ncbi:MAG: discoidin domain-containing protein [Firmicutes bacterium]|nr:discoidin domain-containing protein [Bacillota bacterium]